MLGARRVRTPVCVVVEHEPRGEGVLEKLVFGFGPLLRAPSARANFFINLLGGFERCLMGGYPPNGTIFFVFFLANLLCRGEILLQGGKLMLNYYKIVKVTYYKFELKWH